MFTEWLRRKVFWMLDSWKHGEIGKEYHDIDRIMKMDLAGQKKIQEEYALQLIEHARNTTPYYQMCLKDIYDLKSCPVIDKNMIKNHYDDFQSAQYMDKPKHLMTTSGSTGTPFTMIQDMRKRHRVLAELIWFNQFAGIEVGDKFAYFRVWTERNRNSKLQQLMKNMVPLNILSFSDENFEKIRQVLKKDKRIKSALGYVSTYDYLVRYLDRCKDTGDMFHMHTVITGSEILEPEVKRHIQKTLGCNVVSRYSNEENGVLAQQCLSSNEYHVNSASYIIEVLKMESEETAEIGEVGRVVVTDLFNYAMPLIRYDTGDLAIKTEHSECGVQTELLENIQGRRVDVIYDTQGNPLTPHTWSVYMWRFDKLAQYQFIQEGEKDYILNVNGAEGIYRDQEFVEQLKEILGADAQVTINHVNEIPHLASGKFKKTVCNYKKE